MGVKCMETRFTFPERGLNRIKKIVPQLKGGATSKEKVVTIEGADLNVKRIKLFFESLPWQTKRTKDRRYYI